MSGHVGRPLTVMLSLFCHGAGSVEVQAWRMGPKWLFWNMCGRVSSSTVRVVCPLEGDERRCNETSGLGCLWRLRAPGGLYSKWIVNGTDCVEELMSQLPCCADLVTVQVSDVTLVYLRFSPHTSPSAVADGYLVDFLINPAFWVRLSFLPFLNFWQNQIFNKVTDEHILTLNRTIKDTINPLKALF